MMSIETVPGKMGNLVVISASILFISLLVSAQARADLIGPPLPQPVSDSNTVTSKYFMQGQIDSSRGFSYVAPSAGTVSMLRLQIGTPAYYYYPFEFLILRPTGASNQFTTVQQIKGQENSTYNTATGVSESTINPTQIEAGDHIAIVNNGTDGKGTGFISKALVPGTANDIIHVSTVAASPFQFNPWEGGPNAYIAMNAEFTPDKPSDTTAPKLSGFKFSPKKFRAGGKGSSATAAKKSKKKRKAKKGTTIKLTSSEDATATITFKREVKGYKKGKKCKARNKKSKKGRKAKKCTKLKEVGSMTTVVSEGGNKIAFSGKADGKKLKQGRYQALATATDETDNTSKEVKANFRIVKK